MAEYKRIIRRFEDVPGSALRFRNFAGKPGKYNAEGNKNFCIMIDPEIADEMSAEGWNIRWLNPKDPADEPAPYLPVKVVFDKGRPPKVVQVTKRGKTTLDAKTVNNLDWAEIESADIAINGSPYNVNGKSGISAYLKTMFAIISEDDFEDKYYDIPDSAQNIVDEEDD